MVNQLPMTLPEMESISKIKTLECESKVENYKPYAGKIESRFQNRKPYTSKLRCYYAIAREKLNDIYTIREKPNDICTIPGGKRRVPLLAPIHKNELYLRRKCPGILHVDEVTIAHCVHTLAPACAWNESTEPKKRSRSIASRLGNAIRAMKPLAKRSEEEPITEVVVLNAAAIKDLEDCSLVKETLDYDEIATQAGGSRRSSFSLASQSSSACLSESVEEMMLPGTPEEISPSSSQLRKSETSGSELQALAHVIADRAQSKFSGRVYQDVRNAFLAVDTNGDGKLTPTEALAFCQHFDLSPATTSRFFTLLDLSETGLADWSSFLARYAPVFTKKTDLKRNPDMGRKLPAIQLVADHM